MRVWRLLNSRLVASLCAVAVLLLAAWFALRPVFKLTDVFDRDDLQRVDTLSRLQLLSFAETPTSEEHAQKFVGRVRNNSTRLINGITGAVGFYDDTKALKDLFTERLDGVTLLKPGGEADFAIVRPAHRDGSNTKPFKITAPHVEMRFVDVSLSHDAP